MGVAWDLTHNADVISMAEWMRSWWDMQFCRCGEQGEGEIFAQGEIKFLMWVGAEALA
jgi:hypothetical protein